MVRLIALRVCLSAEVGAQEPIRQVTPAAQQPAEAATYVLDRTIALHLDQTPLCDALMAIGVQGHVKLVYLEDQLPLNRRVSLITDRITVGAALEVVLEGTDLGVLEVGAGQSPPLHAGPPRG